jgi:hypothetical protein
LLVLPVIQKDLLLSPTGAQWVINGYPPALAALFASAGGSPTGTGAAVNGKGRNGISATRYDAPAPRPLPCERPHDAAYGPLRHAPPATVASRDPARQPLMLASSAGNPRMSRRTST